MNCTLGSSLFKEFFSPSSLHISGILTVQKALLHLFLLFFLELLHSYVTAPRSALHFSYFSLKISVPFSFALGYSDHFCS